MKGKKVKDTLGNLVRWRAPWATEDPCSEIRIIGLYMYSLVPGPALSVHCYPIRGHLCKLSCSYCQKTGVGLAILQMETGPDKGCELQSVQS